MFLQFVRVELLLERMPELLFHDVNDCSLKPSWVQGPASREQLVSLTVHPRRRLNIISGIYYIAGRPIVRRKPGKKFEQKSFRNSRRGGATNITLCHLYTMLYLKARVSNHYELLRFKDSSWRHRDCCYQYYNYNLCVPYCFTLAESIRIF